MKVLNIIFLCLMTSFVYADNLSAVSGEDFSLNEKGNSIKKDIQNSLGDYYLSEGNVLSPEKESSEETEWVPISPPYDCTPWTLNVSGEEERTCSVKKSKISTVKKFNEINVSLLNDFNLNYEEKEDTIVQKRAYSAVPTTPSDPTKEIPEYTSGIVVNVDSPLQAGLGEAFPMKWTSTNAVECTVPQNGVKGGAGTEYATLFNLGVTNLTVTCTDGIDSGSKTFPIEIVAIPLELTINTPIENAVYNYKEAYTLSWNSKGANSCSIDGGPYSQNNVNTSRTMSGAGVDITHVVTCTNGVDSITKSVNIRGVLTPPTNGDCTWGSSTDSRLGVTYPFPDTRYNSKVSYFQLRNGQSGNISEPTSKYCSTSCYTIHSSSFASSCDTTRRICTWVSSTRKECFTQCCKRKYGTYYHTVSCKDGVVTDSYNFDSCDPSGRKTSRKLQDFNKSVYQWYYDYGYKSKLIWSWPQ